MIPSNDTELTELGAKLLASPLMFISYFYKLRTGRDYIISQPVSREPREVIIARAFLDIFDLKIKNLILNIPPRYGKTEFLIHFVTWGLAFYPDSNFLFISYAKSLAARQTRTIKEILSLPFYKKLFGVQIKSDSKARDDFETTAGGSVFAAGTDGPITGRGAGVQGVIDRFSGAAIIDDSIKPDEASSDTIREGINDWYFNTMKSRINNRDTPIILSGQRTHQRDLPGYLMEIERWDKLIIPALDNHNNALDNTKHTTQDLLVMKEVNPYVFFSQYQQEPVAPGSGLFRIDDFCLLDDEPEMLVTFITADTAESIKDYADYTVFSFWGLYKIKNSEFVTNQYGLHWIDCLQERIEPRDLRGEFMAFYGRCQAYPEPPRLATIEKKSSGTTLVSVLNEVRGLDIVPIERTVASKPKADRYIDMQAYVGKKLISLSRYAKHTNMCIDHMSKITVNMAQSYDDICDTAYDAVKIAFIDKSLDFYLKKEKGSEDATKNMLAAHNRLMQLKGRAYK